MKAMNWKRFAVEIFAGCAAMTVPLHTTLAQQCNCQNGTAVLLNAPIEGGTGSSATSVPYIDPFANSNGQLAVQNRLPAGWPNQFGDPALRDSSVARINRNTVNGNSSQSASTTRQQATATQQSTAPKSGSGPPQTSRPGPHQT